jgi:hypothetical protein
LRTLRVVFFGFAAIVALVACLIWFTIPSAKSGQLVVPAKTAFTKGPYFLYLQPWGGEQVSWTRPWARHADAATVDLKRFPAETTMVWRWPPMAPSGGTGVWGYDQVSYGNYDGGLPEQAVAPLRVRDLKALRQSFRWSIANRLGEGNVLTEFYLRSSATDGDAKTLEIGWFLHTPAISRKFFDGSRLIGLYIDEQGRRWTVRIADKFTMFAPEKAGDIPSGTIDMLHALRWLQAKGAVTGAEWMWGVAIGVELVRGYGSFTLHDWKVERR